MLIMLGCGARAKIVAKSPCWAIVCILPGNVAGSLLLMLSFWPDDCLLSFLIAFVPPSSLKCSGVTKYRPPEGSVLLPFRSLNRDLDGLAWTPNQPLRES